MMNYKNEEQDTANHVAEQLETLASMVRWGDCESFSLERSVHGATFTLKYDQTPELLESILVHPARVSLPPKMEPIEKDDHLMTMEEFRDACNSGNLRDCDGFGEYATATEKSDIPVYPSDHQKLDKWTHVVWYNK